MKKVQSQANNYICREVLNVAITSSLLMLATALVMACKTTSFPRNGFVCYIFKERYLQVNGRSLDFL